ncbi:mitochondrial ribonuclease P catalytic subunit [Salminus brasiliensis]|uniref:mitochondrial ribonuclease P catalytic subunit n=1 Tax=Salminus brasiliensis TaxID=930266 RepID=UPI003B8347BF
MGSFVLTNARTCVRYLQPLFGHHLYRQRLPVGLPTSEHPTARLFSTKKEKRLPVEGWKRRDGTSEGNRPFRSVFAAGTAKRSADYFRNRAAVEKEPASRLLRDVGISIPDRPLSPLEWSKLREGSPRPEIFQNMMMNLMLSARSDINVAKSFLAYVAKERGTVPYDMLVKYVALCVSEGHHSEILDTYDIMSNCFKSLDTGAYRLFIKGFSQTERWREVLMMLEEIKKVITPSVHNYGDAIAGAFLHGDSQTGWMLYGEILEMGLTPSQDTWHCLFTSSLAKPEDKDRLLGVLMYMRENQLYPEELLAKTIKTWFESLPGEEWRGSFSSVTVRGLCRSCQAELESIELTEEEYAQLKHRVMTDVIEGRDVFKKTTPEELNTFKKFVKRSPVFDVIVDGLNVACISPKSPKAQTLFAVVSELQNQGLNVLVLGRKHMLQSMTWRTHINQIKEIAHCFFTENISEDDPFLLYAALHSGNHCKFVSRDLMRDHKACLLDNAAQRLFFKWQRGHQLVVPGYVPGQKVRFQRALPYDTIVQSDGTSWHIPYDQDGESRSTYEVPQRWLCLTRKH